MAHNPALVGKAGELLVAAELMRRGVEVAYPASDVGVDLLAYRLSPHQSVPTRFVPIQVKTRAVTGYNFQRSWFDRAKGLTLVHVWHVETVPEFYVFESLARVEEALGPIHASSKSWKVRGDYNVTCPGPDSGIRERMQGHRDKWNRITDQLL
jgi:hypothetical protein